MGELPVGDEEMRYESMRDGSGVAWCRGVSGGWDGVFAAASRSGSGEKTVLWTLGFVCYGV